LDEHHGHCPSWLTPLKSHCRHGNKARTFSQILSLLST
jgi:hypothetical protein